METLYRIRNRCAETCDCYFFLTVILALLLGFVSVTNVYFLIDRHNEIWQKTFYRVSLYSLQNFFFVWRVCQIRKLQNSLYDTFVWILITFFPIVVSDTFLELFLYLRMGKDSSYKSKIENNRFPGSEQSMIGMYFQLYLYSFFLTFFAQIGFIVYRVMYCRGRRRDILNQEELKQQIQQKLIKNNTQYTAQELRSKQCSICQAEMYVNEDIIKLGCRHMFHKECIFQWLLRTNRQYGYLKCPNCRNDLID